jgi:hypothetical protein
MTEAYGFVAFVFALTAVPPLIGASSVAISSISSATAPQPAANPIKEDSARERAVDCCRPMFHRY